MLTVVLETPGVGMVTAPVVGGELEYRLDRYPRFRLDVQMRPEHGSVHVWQAPYGTRAHVTGPDGKLMFSGPLHWSGITRPDGRWAVQASDDSLYLTLFQTGNRPGQFLPGTTTNVKGFIEALASLAGAPVRVAGDAGTVDLRGLDISSANAWSLVEEQLIANGLDVWPRGDGTLEVGPTAAIKPRPDHRLTVGPDGTITAYDLTMERVYNRVVLTYEASKDGESETRYIDGVWSDTTTSAGIGIGVHPYTKTVRVGQDWWDDPAGHQAQANAGAAALAQLVRGAARAATVAAVPRYDVLPGETVEVGFYSGVSDRFLVVGAAWPLAAGPMRLDVRNSEPDWPGSTLFKEEAGHARLHAP